MLEWNCWRDWGGHSGREEREIEKEVRDVTKCWELVRSITAVFIDR